MPPPMIQSQSPLVSVIIPTFNNVAYVGKAVESVLNQTFSDFELIVIDDGSTDGTQEVLRKNDGRITYIYQANSGVSSARNHGLRLARGRYIAFLDGDDTFMPTKLAEQAAYLDAHPTIGCVHSGWQVVDEQGLPLSTVEPWHDAPRLDLEAWLLWKPVFLGAMMFRREWLARVGGFHPNWQQAEDVDLLLRLSLKGCRVTWLHLPTVCYRQHSHNTMHKGRQQAQSINEVLTTFYARPDLPYSIRRSQNRIRYFTLMWVVWQLYLTGHTGEMVFYLRQTRPFMHHGAVLTALHWVTQLAQHAHREGVSARQLRDFFPFFMAVLADEDVAWGNIELSMNGWLDVWYPFLQGQEHLATQGIRPYRHWSPRDWTKFLRNCLLASPTAVSPHTVQQFWQMLLAEGAIPAHSRWQVKTVHLTLAGQSLWRRQWNRACEALGQAVQNGRRLPTAFPR